MLIYFFFLPEFPQRLKGKKYAQQEKRIYNYMISNNNASKHKTWYIKVREDDYIIICNLLWVRYIF